jgi:hypothetical protein
LLYPTSCSDHSSRYSVISIVQHFAIENAREGKCVARLSKPQTKSDYPSGEKGQLKKARLSLTGIEPGAHLRHRGAEFGGRATHFDKVHANRPAERAFK